MTPRRPISGLRLTPFAVAIVLAILAAVAAPGAAPSSGAASPASQTLRAPDPAPPAPDSAPRILLADSCEDLAAWAALHTHGDACSVRIAPDSGRTGKGLKLDFSFIGYMGSVSAMRKTQVTLPEDFEISVDLRADAPVNHFLIKVLDSLDNVWWSARWNYHYPREWTTLRLKRRHLPYAWGPSGPMPLKSMDRIEFVVDVGNEAGRGTVWLDNFQIRDLGGISGPSVRPTVRVTSSDPGGMPEVSGDGRRVTGWSNLTGDPGGRLMLDRGSRGDLGGLAIDWGAERWATDFSILLSDDGTSWRRAYDVRNGAGGRNWIYLPDEEARFIALDVAATRDGRGTELTAMRVLDPEFSFSRNDMYRMIASESPRGSYPRYYVPEQSYWTVIGAPGDRKEALMNEQGMIETDKLGFSLEPFLFVDGALVTWADVTTVPMLERDFMPMPSVRWEHRSGLQMIASAFADGGPDSSVLLVRYRLANASGARKRGKVFIAARPFQVNPPWQTFTIHGGVSRIDSVRDDGVIRINGRAVIPMTGPASFGAASFDQGDITSYLRKGVVPPSGTVVDPAGLASAALLYDFDIREGEATDILLAIPFHSQTGGARRGMPASEASAFYDSARAGAVRSWGERLTRVRFRLPAAGQAVENTLRSNLGFILVNADSVWTQPGSRSYERSWIRDGALTATAMLQMGLTREVREYIDWYSRYQFPDGAIPCIVETRGPDPVPEHDSHGQFIYMIGQYFRFTRDTAWLRTRWDNVLKAARHIQSLRASRKTEAYRTGTPVQRACYGLVPESISHEGYSPKPMHSYWDNFFALRGIKDAAGLASALGLKAIEEEFAAELSDYRRALSNSIVAAAALHGLTVIPGCVELGDVGGMSTTVAITPADELGHLPEPLTRHSFDTYFDEWSAREKAPPPGGAYLPYEARFIGAYVMLGERERAVAFMDHLMADRRPAAWNQWAEVVWHDSLAPRNIGDMPHTWVASDFIRSVRSMFAYEREADTSLVIGAGIPDRWLEDPAGIGVEQLPTHYGLLDYTMRREGKKIIVEIGGEISLPPGGIVVMVPTGHEHGSAGSATAAPVPRSIVRKLPARILLGE